MVDGPGDWLSGEVVVAADAFAQRLEAIDDTGRKVPNLEWSVAELAAHLISLPPLYRRLNVDEPFEPPDDWPAYSRAARAHITTTDRSELAALVREGAAGFLAELGPDPDRPWRLYGRSTTAANMAAGYLGELLLHGDDLARFGGPRVTITTDQANAILRQHMTLAPVFVDPDRARRCEGTYSVRFRGGDEYTFVVADGALTVRPGRPGRADGTVRADPSTFLAVALGRRGTVGPSLTGKIMAWGRNPVKLFRLGNITVDGI